MAEIMEEKALEWDDEITKESEYILLPEGDYNFTVESFQRERHEGSEKLPPCWKAAIKLVVVTPEGDEANIYHNIFLHTKTEGMLSAFFAGIGQKKKGEPLKMDWQKVPGSTGKAKVGIRTYNDRQYNEVKKFYPKEDGPAFQAGSF